eukprot:6347983-Amphidinium_carterae.1
MQCVSREERGKESAFVCIYSAHLIVQHRWACETAADIAVANLVSGRVLFDVSNIGCKYGV